VATQSETTPAAVEGGPASVDERLTGREFARARSRACDEWLAGLFVAAGGDSRPGVALVAMGGYGRGELAPFSDLDVLLLHDRKVDVGDLADQLWYPVWDAGLKLGHAVRTVKETLKLAADDLDTATALLSVRHLAGDSALTKDLATAARTDWVRRGDRWLGELAAALDEREHRFGEVAFLLEPDLKEGRGGLRDVHALTWAGVAEPVLLDGDGRALEVAETVLIETRVALHRQTGRPGDRLLLQDQDAVAAALGYADADALMAAVSDAARTIAWVADETWDRVTSRLDRGRAVDPGPVGPGLAIHDGHLHLTREADPSGDPALLLRAAAAAAHHRVRLDRVALDRLAVDAPPLPDPWPDEARDALVDLLLTGPPALDVLEALDRRDLVTRVLPEWAPNRSRPQRNAYHQYTVDRHLWEAAVQAAALADRVGRPDLLVLGALLHDIGKGYPGDHSEVGVDLVRAIATRMGFPPDDVDTLCALVRHHLLLPDIATRRDLGDDATMRHVAELVGSTETLELLGALTEADSVATGPSAWGPWKAELVEKLVERTARLIEQGHVGDADFPTAEHRRLMVTGERVVHGEEDRLAVVTADRPGTLGRVAGVLAIEGLDILMAEATSEEGMALSTFRVRPRHGQELDWVHLTGRVEAALDGRVALQARVAERARTYDRDTVPEANPAPPEVRIDNDVSDSATVIEVHAPDRTGVLYRITRALADLELDVRSAMVQTLGHRVVDSFYVRDIHGGKISDPDHLVEIEKALLHSL
jgi:[protein-PII] uridylyltransferase